jgi:acyl-CoA thioester hydrolase
VSGSDNRQAPSKRSCYRRFTAVTPRWKDNDVFGHVNNAEYFSYFDTAVMRFMIDERVLNITGGSVGTLVAESGCRFHREVTFQDSICVGLRIGRLGNSSVRYEIGVFTNDEQAAAADGHFVHVFIDRATKRPSRIPDSARALFEQLLN